MPVRDFVATFDTDFAEVVSEVYYAIDVTLSATHFRVSNADFTIVIGANSYTPYYSGLSVPALVNGENINQVTIKVANKIDSATSLGRYDWSEDIAGSAITVWQVRYWRDGGARKQIEDEVWIGYVLSVSGNEQWVELICTQELGLGSRPANRTCWQKCGYYLGDSRCEYSGASTTCDYTLESCGEKIYTTDESGGLTTTTMTGPYTDTGSPKYYVFKISTADPANPNKYKWLAVTAAPAVLPGVGEAWSAEVNCAVAATAVENGLKVAFDAVTGNGAVDVWCWVKCSNIDRYGGFLMIPKPGSQLVTGGQVSTISGPGGASPYGVPRWSDPGGNEPSHVPPPSGAQQAGAATGGDEPAGYGWGHAHGGPGQNTGSVGG